MCSYNITLNDALVEKVRPSFANDEALEQWLQQQMEGLLVEFYASQIESQETTPPPCQYSVDEAVQRVLLASEDVDAGRNLTSLDDFEKIVDTW